MAEKSFLIDPALNQYVVAHAYQEPDVLTKLREETARHAEAQMQITPEQGQFLSLLVKATGARKALEVGVFTGYSSIVVALALPANGRLVACDRSEEFTNVARRYWAMAGVAGKIELKLGPAADTLEALIDEGQAGSFDFAFIDADKTGYRQYYELALKLIRQGGLLLFDNMLQHGRVIDREANDENVVAIRELNDLLARDERVVSTLLPIADGVTLSVKQ